MPELPEVEVVKQSLEKHILNKRLSKIIVKNKKLRFSIPKNLSKNLSNLKILNVKRVAKYVVIEFEHNYFLVMHFGMSGTLHLIKNIRNSKNAWIPTSHWIGGFIWYYIQSGVVIVTSAISSQLGAENYYLSMNVLKIIAPLGLLTLIMFLYYRIKTVRLRPNIS